MTGPETPATAPPSTWPIGWGTTSYGIDYAFLPFPRRVPAPWKAEAITVRFRAGDQDHTPDLRETALFVLDEIRAISTLRFTVATDFGRDEPVAAPAPQEIRVACAAPGERVDGLGRGTLGIGGVQLASRDGRASGGFAMLADPARIAAADSTMLAVVRHEIGHAVGLGHAKRRGLVMNSVGSDEPWGVGDRMGLALIAEYSSGQECTCRME
ncbi:hypothetical protein [Nocardia sp. NPDC057227]|uniref:hypothetical protein n=1 Tax=Nocardia sp. NPDC057227 TaxID=3346056 RepID=UPI00362B6F65